MDVSSLLEIVIRQIAVIHRLLVVFTAAGGSVGLAAGACGMGRVTPNAFLRPARLVCGVALEGTIFVLTTEVVSDLSWRCVVVSGLSAACAHRSAFCHPTPD